MSEPPNIPSAGGPGYQPPYPGQQPGQYPGYPPVTGPPGTYPPLDADPNKPDIGAAFSWAWGTLRDNIWPVLLPGVLLIVGVAVGIALYAAGFAWALNGVQTVTDAYGNSVTTGSVHGAGFVLVALAIVLMVVVSAYLSAALIAGAFRALDGEPITSRTFITTRRFWPLIAVGILVGICVIIGLALCIIPGLILIVMFQFAPFFVVDRGLSPIDAMRESWNLARRYVGDSILIYLATYGINAVGVFLCYIGAIVTAPLSMLFHACTFRQMTGSPIAGAFRTVPQQPGWPGQQQAWGAPPQAWDGRPQQPQWPAPAPQPPQQPHWPAPPQQPWPQQPPQPGMQQPPQPGGQWPLQPPYPGPPQAPTP